MKYLLCGINAKYIHSNLAVYSLKKYADLRGPESAQIQITEYTINHYVDDILRGLYLEKADVLIFSCYIWNIRYVKELCREMKKVRPDMPIWVGGPEVTYEPEDFLKENKAVDLVMIGEGEQVFTDLVSCYEKNQDIRNLRGLVFRDGDSIINNGFAPVMDLDQVPFVYDDIHLFNHKIMYYETSRGCPFACTYCLSSVEETTRFRSEDLVAVELQKFLDAKVPQVKFVDRTFNCNRDHAMFIWKYIHEHDNGVTNFHFEISSDLLDDEEIALFSKMRVGLIQLEIGLQTTYPPAIASIDRHMDLDLLFANVDKVHSFGNVHQHLDLIAGLPFEDFEHFGHSFDDLYRHHPDQLQLGFLKVLKGTRMKQMAGQYGIVYCSEAPYEVLKTNDLPYDDVIRLKGIEELVELYYNSGQYEYTLQYVVPFFESPFQFFKEFSEDYHDRGLDKANHNRMEKYQILRHFLLDSGKRMPYLDQVMLYDIYLRENVKSRPDWAPDQTGDKKQWKELYRSQGNLLFPGKKDYDSKKAANKSHIERFSLDIEAMLEKGVYQKKDCRVLFDYTERSPLDHNARTLVF